jgi:tetratricopeptide (TPR) repeat protein
VKIRTADDLVFLQDEMYTLMEKVHKDSEAILQRNRINADILAFYDWKIRQTRWKIDEMEKDLQVVGEITADKLVQTGKRSIVPEEEKMRRARARLQAYQVEQVYYTLQVDALEGFRLYSQYAEESFQSRDLNLWLLLRDELLRFANKKGNLPTEGLTSNDIDADMGGRWVKVSLADDKNVEAEEQIKQFRDACPDLVRPGNYADLSLKIWETWILAYTGRDHEKAWKLLSEILEKVEGLPSKTSLDRWRINFLKAYAISMQGFLYRTQGEFKQAVKNYLQAVPLWRELKLELEASNNLNNLAWAEAEAGDFQTALVHCKDGLHLRRKLGRRYLIGLSLNTLGLIETRAGSPERARFHCWQALEIFRGMEVTVGIGLACIAFAESLRRMTNADLLAHEQAIEHLKEASRYAEEAVNIFSEQVKQPLRLVESYIEVGCVYREWVRHLSIDNVERLEKVEKSRAAYEAAVAVAEEGNYEYRAIDALVNMAWLYYYAGDVETAEDVLGQRVRNRLGHEHLYTKEHGVDDSHAPTSWNWVQLGKANVLLGMIHFDQYKQANRAKQKPEAERKLRQAAHNWTLSMAYNSLYGKSFRDFTKGREDVYERLEQLNNEEMYWIEDSMNRTHREYHFAEDQRAFEQFLKERFGLAL